MNRAKWIAHFQRNREQRTEPDWAAPFNLPESVLKHLRPSLAEYQLGDGGDFLAVAHDSHPRYHGLQPEPKRIASDSEMRPIACEHDELHFACPGFALDCKSRRAIWNQEHGDMLTSEDS